MDRDYVAPAHAASRAAHFAPEEGQCEGCRRYTSSMTPPVILALPFAGRWRAMNSPARRVPSHGSDLLGTRYAIDFVGVDDRGRTASRFDARSLLGTEPVERFAAFGRPILAPVTGTVVAVHDGESDEVARRSIVAGVPFLLGQAARLRRGSIAITGNHVIIAAGDVFVGLVHLRHGSVRVAVGDTVAVGDQLGECGNSGNSTQPHVHVQAMDSLDLTVAQGLPIAFRDYREWVDAEPVTRTTGMPAEGAIVEAV